MCPPYVVSPRVRRRPFPSIPAHEWFGTARCVISIHQVEQGTNLQYCAECFTCESRTTNSTNVGYYDVGIKHYIWIGTGIYYEECARCHVVLGNERPAHHCADCRAALLSFADSVTETRARPYDDPVPTVITLSYQRIPFAKQE